MEEHIKTMMPLLDEKQKRLFLASLAKTHGHGGVPFVNNSLRAWSVTADCERSKCGQSIIEIEEHTLNQRNRASFGHGMLRDKAARISLTSRSSFSSRSTSA